MSNLMIKGMNVHLYQQGSYGFINRVPLLFQRPASYRTKLFKCTRTQKHFVNSSAHLSQDEICSDLEKEMRQAKKEARPYRIDKSKLSDKEKQKLRLHSKSIPLVADSEPLDVIHEDDNFLVVNKPAFLKMHPSHRFQGGSLLNRAIGHCGFAPYLLHRLDMHTTGVVIMAKKKKLCKPIMHQFMNGLVKKEYLCVVDGLCDGQIGSSFWIDAPIQRHPLVQFVRQIGDSQPDAKPSSTKYTILDKSEEKNMMLLHVVPETGRTHQIRVHASSWSIPIVGDDLYNPRERKMYSSYDEITEAAKDPSMTKYGDDNPLRKGLKLHAWKIRLAHPESSERVTFCAYPPSHINSLLDWSGMQLPPQEDMKLSSDH